MNTLFIILSTVILFLLLLFLYLKLPRFGKEPQGERLKKIKHSPNFRNGRFHNKIEVPKFTEVGNFVKAIFEFLFAGERTRPEEPVPSVKTNLKTLGSSENMLVWFGHSSYLIKTEGKNILVDPVLSGNASAIPNQNKAFKGSDLYTCEDMPEIDFLFLTHNHWDHLDYKTICELKRKTGKFICPLGVGATLEYWGIKPGNIIENDWDQKFNLAPGLTVHTVAAQHFSGRGLQRNKTLWTSYILETAEKKIFLGGDSGYEKHFALVKSSARLTSQCLNADSITNTGDICICFPKTRYRQQQISGRQSFCRYTLENLYFPPIPGMSPLGNSQNLGKTPTLCCYYQLSERN